MTLTFETFLIVCPMLFLAGFVVAGLGFRLGWYILPRTVSFGAAAVFLAAYLLYAEVLRENTYLSRTIEVQENQKVIDTGLYAVVRHPMYTATVFLFLSIPLVLGSWIGFAAFVPFIPVLMMRAIEEEKLLVQELNGYADYQQKVKWRLMPFVW